ncbi:hypothetical protein EUA02_30115 [Mycobacterium paragordonae]|nr:hypothetical protein EI067_31570 [Mycobacterium paragordonae]TDK85337.1 hypothetical protein EUA02_30115 [Mycobacterium paragordonae]TDK98631.1 hypothetical protein EUA05_31285 [Mycobacterium paragordonae]
MPGGIQPLARSVTSRVVLSARSPAAQARRGCWRATVLTKRCNRFRAVASAEAVPIAAPVAVAATAWVPCVGGGGGGAEEAVWRTSAGWLAAACPDEGVTGAEDGVAEGGRGVLCGGVGVIVVATGGRRSEP